MIQDINSNYQWDTNEIYTQGGPYKDMFPIIFRFGSRYKKNDLSIVGDIGFITDSMTRLEESTFVFWTSSKGWGRIWIS